ncbi:hypothetical protein ASG11_00915 [Sphingomonas sp. Leaf357]|nr:hypothetical protein ASG11_00915 [Sphingomonas sp. Leaf357]
MQFIDTTAGAGDSAKAGGDKINASLQALARRTGRHAPVHCLFDGDSKYAEIKTGLQWMAAFEGLDLRFDGGELGIGGSTSGTGAGNLLSPARLATARTVLDAHSAAGRTIDYYLTIGTNDTSANLPPATVLANIRKFHEQVLRPQGCFRYLVLVSVDPRSPGSATGASYIHTINRLYDEYALANPLDVLFVDTTGMLIDPALANANGYPIPFGATAAPMPAGAVTDDGLHCSNYGKYLKRFAVAPLRDLYRRKPARSLSRALAAAGPNGSGANMVPGGRTVEIGGTISLTNNGTGAMTGTPPAGFTLSGTIDGTLGVGFAASTVTVATDGGLIPRGTWPCVRASFSGTSGANTTGIAISIVANPDRTIEIGDLVTSGALVNFNALTGILGIAVTANNPGAVSGVTIGATGVNGSPLAQAIVQAIDGPMLLEGDDVPASSAQNAFFQTLNLYLPPNTAISGSVDLLAIFAERIGPLPAATP